MNSSLSTLLHRGWERYCRFCNQTFVPSVALTSLQVMMIYLWTNREHYGLSFTALNQRDSLWYLSIVKRGYQFMGFDAITLEGSNAAFFPGYPIAVAWVSQYWGIDPNIGLYLTSHLFCCLMWIYLFLFWKRWKIPLYWQILANLIILLYPTSFFLNVGYSESIFIASLLGFLYWSADPKHSLLMVVAGLHGLVMSATRIVGLPVALLPIINLWNHPDPESRPQRLLWSGGTIFLGLLGGLSFFLYCQIHFGRWDLYLEMQRYFTGVKANYQAIFQAQTYFLSPEFWQKLFSLSALLTDQEWANPLSQLFVPLTLGALMFTSLMDGISVVIGKSQRWQERLGFHCAAWVMFYIAVSGMSALIQRSMSRYCFPVHIMQVLAVVHWLKYTDLSPIPTRLRPYLSDGLKLGYMLLCQVFLALNLVLTWRYVHHLWVA
jgi:hypothetical protein